MTGSGSPRPDEGAGAADEPIECYLDQLVAGLVPLGPRRLRHLLAEAEAHLRDSAAEAMAGGMDERNAQRDAVRRFGPVDDVVGAERDRHVVPLVAVAGQTVSSAWVLGSIAAIAVGVSGLIAELVRLVAGIPALVDVAPGQALSAADCARWRAGDPAAPTCRAAALTDWAAEVVGYRVALGLVGAIALAGYLIVRHLLRRNGVRGVAARPGWGTLPPAVSDTIAFTGFALAGAWTLLLGLNALITAAGNGSGQWFSAAPVALGAAAVFGRRLVRDLQSDPGVPARV